MIAGIPGNGSGLRYMQYEFVSLYASADSCNTVSKGVRS